MKKCCTCKITYDYLEFHKNKRSKDGRQDRCKKCCKIHNYLNKERRTKYYKKWYEDNKEKVLLYQQNYFQDNKEDIFIYRNNYKNSNPLVKLRCRLSSRTAMAFTRSRWVKNGTTEILLGNSFSKVYKHIENLFTDDMSWGNFDKIHIDHIIPLSSANTEAELIALCHYKNLQPLWAKDNLSKGSKIY